METQHLFIDTSIFRNKSFDLTNDSLKTLRNVANDGDVSLHTTSITKRECEKNLLEMIDEQEGKINKLNVHLRNGNKEELNFKKLRKNRLENWKEFKSEFNEIPIYNKSVDQIFDNYFDSKPPFDGKNKKSEFPDAFILETLSNWASENKSQIYVISSDIPFSAFKSTQILHLESIEEFLDILSKYKEEKLYEFAETAYSILQDEISTDIKEQIESASFYTLDLWDSEIVDVEIDRVESLKPYFLNINHNYCLLDVDVNIYFSSTLTYADPNMIYRDSDTKDFVVLERIDDSISTGITVTVTVEMNLADMQESSVSLISVNLPKEIEENLTSDNYEDFKLNISV